MVIPYISALVLYFSVILSLQATENVNSATLTLKARSAVQTEFKHIRQKWQASSIAIFSRDNIILKQSFGYIDKEKTKPYKNTHAVLQGSISKTFMAVVVMQMITDGLIESVNTPVNNYLKRHKLSNDNVTVADLMSHNSGLPGQYHPYLYKNDEHKFDHRISQLVPNDFQLPNDTGPIYSNHSAAVLAIMLEDITDKPISKLLEKYVFKPFDMKNAALMSSIEGRKLQSYTSGVTAENYVPVFDKYNQYLAAAFSTAASLNDMVKFVTKALIRDPLLLSLEEELSSSYFDYSYGAFLRIAEYPTSDGKRVTYYSHGGMTDITQTVFIYIPEKNVGIYLSFLTPKHDYIAIVGDVRKSAVKILNSMGYIDTNRTSTIPKEANGYYPIQLTSSQLNNQGFRQWAANSFKLTDRLPKSFSVNRFSQLETDNPILVKRIFNNDSRSFNCMRSYNTSFFCKAGDDQTSTFIYKKLNNKHYIAGSAKISILDVSYLKLMSPLALLIVLLIEILLLIYLALFFKNAPPFVLLVSLITASLFCALFLFYKADFRTQIRNGEMIVTNILYITLLTNLACSSFLLTYPYKNLVAKARSNPKDINICKIMLLIIITIIILNVSYFSLWRY